MKDSSRRNSVPVEILPPERFYAERLGSTLFERMRSLLETHLLDLAFVLDSLIRLGEVSFDRVPPLVLRTLTDRRFLRLAAVWGTLGFLLTR
jgi:hypothetical protein